jgi:endoglucanase
MYRAFIMALLSWSGLAYHLKDGRVYNDHNEAMRIRGINWFGFETQDKVVNGLWEHPMSFYFDLMATEGFNVVRTPFSSELILYNMDSYPYDGFLTADPQNQHKKSIEILDNFFDMAHARNMSILLDLHRLKWDFISELWYSPMDPRFPSESYFTAWFAILDRYQDHPALWGVDMINEPHGPATWGTNNPSTDWHQFVQYAIPRFEERYPKAKWIYMVEGIGWGKDLTGAHGSPLDFFGTSAEHRVAYSAHSYGKSVVPSVNVYDEGALRADWDSNFGFLAADHKNTVMVGEYGGLTNVDSVWMTSFAKYLVEKQMTDAFFWSLGPNSGDVSGLLLDDWTSVDEFKRGIVQTIQPDPYPKPFIPKPPKSTKLRGSS